MPTTVQIATSSGVSTHVISLRGVAGAIFWCILASFTLNMIAFVTEGWAEANTEKGTVKVGLWQSCLCQPGLVDFAMKAWFRSTQAMVTIASLLLTVTLVIILVYMFIHKFNKAVVIKLLLLCCLLTIMFMLIGFTIFGIHTTRERAMQGYSFIFGIVSCTLCISAAILTCVQMRRSTVCTTCASCCSCCLCCRDDLR